MCYNLLIDAFGQKLQHKKAELIYLQLLESHCVPTEDTYAILLKAYCASGLLEKAEAVFSEMQKNGISSGLLRNQSKLTSFIWISFDDLLNLFISTLNIEFMQKTHPCCSGVVVYNAYIDGLLKARKPQKALEIFQRMKNSRCKPSTDTYTMIINLYGKVSLYLILYNCIESEIH